MRLTEETIREAREFGERDGATPDAIDRMIEWQQKTLASAQAALESLDSLIGELLARQADGLSPEQLREIALALPEWEALQSIRRSPGIDPIAAATPRFGALLREIHRRTLNGLASIEALIGVAKNG